MGVSKMPANTALREAREQEGLTIMGAAYAVGVSDSHWSGMEARGTLPSLRVAFRIARLLGRTIEELFGEVADDSATFDPDVYFARNLLKRG